MEMGMENLLWMNYILSHIFKWVGENKDKESKFWVIEMLNKCTY